MASPTAVTLRLAGQTSVSGEGTAVDLAQRTSADLVLDVTSMSGSLFVAIQTSANGTTGWTDLDEFDNVQQPGVLALTVVGCQRFIRARWTLVGGPATFSVSGSAILVYCTPADVKAMSLTPEALDGIDDVEIDRAIRVETATANSFLGARYQLPLVSWGDDIRAKTSDLTQFRLMLRRGFDPERGSDKIVVSVKDEATTWFRLVASNDLIPDEVVDSTPDVDEADLYMVTDAPRGW